MLTTRVPAVYEKGVLRLERPLELEDGARVEVVVLTIPQKGRTPAELLAEIAALPLEGDQTPFSGEDHDRVLYGGPEAR